VNLVLGAAHGLRAPVLRPFFRSLRDCGYAGRAAMLLLDADPAVRAMLAEYDVDSFGNVPRDLLDRFSVNDLRYGAFARYLDGLAETPEHVFLCDVRDIVFQRDPFSFHPPAGLSVFLEDRRHRIGGSTMNALWLALAFGKESVHELGGHPIICSGTTCGSAAAIRFYLARMAEELEAIAERKPGLSTKYPGVDQGAHNYLIRKGAFPELRIYTNESGPVATLAAVPSGEIRFNEREEIVNRAGKTACLVHQYDRYAEIKTRVLARLGLAGES
jgi:hypothetical protein